MSLALGSTFLILASASFALASASLALAASLAFEGGLDPLPLPLSLASWVLSNPWGGGGSSLGSQGLLRGLLSEGRWKRDGIWNFTNIKVIEYAPRLPPRQVYKDFCNIKGLIPCYIVVVPAYLN